MAGRKGARAGDLHKGSPLQRLAVHLALLVLCVPALLPFLWMLSTSFMSNEDVYGSAEMTQKGLTLIDLIPKTWHPENYTDALKTVPFGTYLANSLGLCITTVVFAVISSAIVAYGFSRLEFKGRSLLFGVMIATMALPGQVTMIPQFAMYRSLEWYGTYLPLVIPALFASPFYVFLLSQFFNTLPMEMAESARVEGAGEFRIFLHLIIPLSKPALATCALFQFLGSWNDFMGPLMYVNDPNRYTLAYGLQQFYSSYGGQWTQLMAAAALFTIPIIILFFFAQKTFIQGVATTGGRN